MSPRVELFATGDAPPEDTWAIVGDPRRLPEWTDVERVERVEPEPLEVGSELVVVADGSSHLWRVVTAQPRLVEFRAETAKGPLALGVRVVRDRAGSRLILAGAYEPAGAVHRLRVRAVDAPALRRRFDRWSRTALRLASTMREG